MYYCGALDCWLAMRATPNDVSALSGTCAQWSAHRDAGPVPLLRNMASGKELCPRFFNDAERRRFDEADAAEWKQQLSTGLRAS